MELEQWNELAEIRAELRDLLIRVDGLLNQRPEIPPPELLSEDQVTEIRRRHRVNEESITALAREYGVNKSTTSRLVRFKTHKNV